MTFLALSPGDERDTPEQLVAYAESHDAYNGAYLLWILISMLLLGWFVGRLCGRLRAAGADDEGVFAVIGGAVFTVLLFLADVIVFAGVTELAKADENVQLAYAQTILNLEDASWFVLAGAGFGAALMIVASSLGARRTGAISGWKLWASLLLGVVSLGTIGFVGALAWLLWVPLGSKPLGIWYES